MTAKHTTQEDIREVKRIIAALKKSYKTMLRIELVPLQNRLTQLETRLARKRRERRSAIVKTRESAAQT